jgi:hypothetical protein
MTNGALFLESILNTSHKVYGHRLLPLSLFHIGMLERISSPLLLGGELTGEDIAKAALICSSKNVQKLESKFRNFVNNILFFLYKPGTEFAKWNAYWNDYFPAPQMMEKEGSSEGKFPYIASCAAAIIQQTGWDFNKVFYEMPVGQLVWLNLAFAFVQSGETNIVSDKEADIMERIKLLQQSLTTAFAPRTLPKEF